MSEKRPAFEKVESEIGGSMFVFHGLQDGEVICEKCLRVIAQEDALIGDGMVVCDECAEVQ